MAYIAMAQATDLRRSMINARNGHLAAEMVERAISKKNARHMSTPGAENIDWTTLIPLDFGV